MKTDTMKKITRQDPMFIEHLMILIDGSPAFKQRVEYMINDYKVRDSDSLEMRIDLKEEENLGFY